MYSWLETLLSIIFVFAGLVWFDKTIEFIDTKTFYNTNTYKKQLIKYEKTIVKKNEERRWYLIHAVINTINAVLTSYDLVHVFSDPMAGVGTDFFTLPMCICIGLHMFHVYQARSEMDMVDWVHHLINAFLVGITTLVYYKGRIVNYIIFFICGFPGALDYYCLSLNKYGMISRMTEKRVNTFQNNWIRSPGIVVGTFIGYMNNLYRGGELGHSTSIVIMLFIFNFVNCVYFAERVTKNYGYHMGLKDMAKRMEKKEEDTESVEN